jgi:hypothetical protein
MCINLDDGQEFTECVPIEFVQNVLDLDEMNTCGQCPETDSPTTAPTTMTPTNEPTLSPTQGPVCEFDECAEDGYVYICNYVDETLSETLCVPQEEAKLLLLDERNFCGKCPEFNCSDIFTCGQNNKKIEICHM